MKKIVILFLMIVACDASFGQVLTEKKMNLSITGFVRNDFIIDSRQNVDGIEELFTYWPVRPDYDANGKDITRHASAKMLNIFTRLGTRLSGLEFGKAKAGAYVEVDFTGSTTTNSLRLRHVYTQFDWPKTNIVFGNTWHPTFIEKVFPGVVAINTGMPFQVFNRSPQLRITHHLTKTFDLITAAVYQSNYVNFGPLGQSYLYQRDAVLPDLHLQGQYFNKNWVIGAGIGYKEIKPREFTTGSDSKKYKTKEKLGTWTALAYLKFIQGKFEMKAKSMYGQNVTEHLLPGGYAIKTLDSKTGFETYTPSNHVYSFINLSYGEKWKISAFYGFTKNLGLSSNPLALDKIYGRGNDIDALMRTAITLSYKYKNLMVSWEPDHTSAKYGRIDLSDKGMVKDGEWVTNVRNLFAVNFYF
jgi:hypothetical protein